MAKKPASSFGLADLASLVGGGEEFAQDAQGHVLNLVDEAGDADVLLAAGLG